MTAGAANAVHDLRALQEPRSEADLSPPARPGPPDARRPDQRLKLDRAQLRSLLPGDGMRRPQTAQAMDRRMERPDGIRDRPSPRQRRDQSDRRALARCSSSFDKLRMRLL